MPGREDSLDRPFQYGNLAGVIGGVLNDAVQELVEALGLGGGCAVF